MKFSHPWIPSEYNNSSGNNSVNFYSFLSQTPHKWIPLAAVFFLLLSLSLFVLYGHVLASIIRAKLWKESTFYIQLLELGGHELFNVVPVLFLSDHISVLGLVHA